MTVNPQTLLTMLQITDTSFPTGAFAFSNGLETLVGEGEVAGAIGVLSFLREQIVPRWLSFDRWFLRAAYSVASEIDGLVEIDHDCEAHNTVDTLAAASRRIGAASLVSHSRIGTPGASKYLDCIQAGGAPGHAPVVQGMVARNLDIELPLAEVGAFFAAVSAPLSAAIRLGTIGALDSQRLLTELRADLVLGLNSPVGETPHAFAPLADIAAIRHRTSATRLFAA